MKAVVLKEFGGVDKLEERDLHIPEVKPNFVRIKLHASSLNPVDYKIRKGNFGGDLPMVLGQDGAGVIDAVGEGVTAFKVGDEVYSFIFGTSKSNGSFAEYASLPQQYVGHKPKSISFEDAAAVPLVGLTAIDIVKRARIEKGKPVFVAGASGGVGSVVIHLLRHLGASPIIVTAGSEKSAGYIHSHLGIPKEHIVRYDGKSDKELQDSVLKLNNGNGFPYAIDLVGGKMKLLCFHVIALYGNVLTIVEEEDPKFITPLYPTQDPNSLFTKSATFNAVFIGAAAFIGKGPEDWEEFRQGLEELAKLIDAGEVKPPQIMKVGKLGAETVRKAMKDIEEGHTIGKLVISIV